MVDRDRPVRDPHRLGHRRRQPQRLRPARTHPASRRRPRPARRRRDPAPGQGLRQLPHHPSCHGLGLTDVVCAKKARKGAPKGTTSRKGAPKTKKPPNGKAKTKKTHTLGLRWPVERTNSWFSNFGQLRRNTDRFSKQRLGQVALAVALILTVKLVKWAKRWTD